MHLCIIIPALNEEASIGDVIQRIQEVPFPAKVTAKTVIVVDDGSRDATGEISRGLGAMVVRHEQNRGVGRAFQSGLKAALAAGADLVVNIDADGQFNPADIPALLAPLLAGEADFVTASRFKDPALEPEMPPVKRWGNRQMSRLVSGIIRHRFHDVSCGFRAYSRETALRLNLWGAFTYTQESFLDLAAKGMRMVEIPLKIRGVREFGESRVARSLWRYARNTAEIIFHAYSNYWPLRFFSILTALAAAPGIGLLTFLFVHYLRTGGFSPHIWAGFVGGGFIFLAIMCFITGLLANILKWIRMNQEEMLYYLKQIHFKAGDGK